LTSIEPRHFVAHGQDQKIYVVTNDCLELVNLDTGVVDHRWNIGGHGPDCISLSPKGDLLAIGNDDRVIRLISTIDASIQQQLVGHIGAIAQLEFTSDGKTLLALDQRGILKLWRVIQGAEVLTWPSNPPIVAFSLSQDENWLAISHPNDIEIINIPQFDELKSVEQTDQ
jgi:WD40 repeat protein